MILTSVVRHCHVTIELPPMRIRILPRLMNVRAAWKASHRTRMLDQSDGSVATVERALFSRWMTSQDQQLAEED